MSVKVLIVDDHPVVREGIVAMLSGDRQIQVVGEASGGAEAIRKSEDLKPDVVLMDISMPEVDGIEATRKIKELHPEIAVVVLTVYEHDSFVIRAVRAGATGYLTKDASRDLVLNTVRLAQSGGSLIKSSLLKVALMGRGFADRSGSESKPISGEVAPGPRAREGWAFQPPLGLTPREMEVLELLAQGRTNKEIAQKLFIANLTAKKHVASIMSKLGVPNRSSAAIWALRNGQERCS
ncbi:MAG: response regulator transcription factor [Chloroflexi bacterium]|nr:response regulator transcription factor [Chloroflexota bacterium]